jgi:Raf kinase inhibitor-like YbhB/YbcL family protein
MRILTVAVALAAGGVGAAHALSLTSPDLKPGGRVADEQVFNGADCAGKNVSPALVWSGAPKGVRSFAVSVYDPDASPSGFWHWWVADIPSSAAFLPKGAGDEKGTGLPAGAVQFRNNFGAIGYGGPCAPSGKPHHYQVSVFALDVEKLSIDAGAPPAVVGAHVRAHALAQATLTAVWGR